MRFFDDLAQFLETQLDQFLKAHPDLELQALEEQLRQQEADTVRLLAESRAEEQRLQNSILATAQEIKTWHSRVEKANAANRPDLAVRAEDRKVALLNQGNQLWGQLKGAQERIQQMENLQRQIQVRRQQLKEQYHTLKAKQKVAAAKAETKQWSGWTKPADPWDDLEKEFQRLEVDQEIKKMRQKGS
jgi:uncharacterized protein (TIGR04376 family)